MDLSAPSGADEVAQVIERQARATGVQIRLGRTGSGGMLWLEPLVEVATDPDWVTCGSVRAEDARVWSRPDARGDRARTTAVFEGWCMPSLKHWRSRTF